jgi:hypothetical protein
MTLLFGTGKTHQMFGGGGGTHEHDKPGIASHIFRAVFAAAGAEETASRVRENKRTPQQQQQQQRDFGSGGGAGGGDFGGLLSDEPVPGAASVAVTYRFGISSWARPCIIHTRPVNSPNTTLLNIVVLPVTLI